MRKILDLTPEHYASGVALSSVYEVQQVGPSSNRTNANRTKNADPPRPQAAGAENQRWVVGGSGVPAGPIRLRGRVRSKGRGGRQPLPEGPYRCGQVPAHADRFWAVDPPAGHHAAAGVEECGAVRGTAPAGPPPVPALHAAIRGRGRLLRIQGSHVLNAKPTSAPHGRMHGAGWPRPGRRWAPGRRGT